MLANVAWPILSYELFTSPSLQASANKVVAITDSFTRREYLVPTPKPTPVVVAQEIDYTDLSNWFPDKQMPLIGPENAKRYSLAIPKLNINEAQVVEGGVNLDHNLIQYPGTADPGQLGSPVIFGHSVLRQFYNPAIDNPRRYTSIFSTIMTLEAGDKIFITNDNVTYAYKVFAKMEVKPEDTYILEQHYDVHELKLVTCVPEGTVLRRGVVLAQLESIQ